MTSLNRYKLSDFEQYFATNCLIKIKNIQKSGVKKDYFSDTSILKGL